MSIQVNGCVLELVQGDIASQEVDAIVNAANARLAGGSGVDHAIHSAGGTAIMEETDRRYPDGCPTGSAVSSGPGNLPCKFVFHAVGPVWHGGDQGEPQQLRGAYHRSLELAVENQCESIAFPALSTGAYGYPMELAAELTLSTVIEFLREHGAPPLVRIVLYMPADLACFRGVLERLS